MYSKTNAMRYFLKKKYDRELFSQSSFFIMTLILQVPFFEISLFKLMVWILNIYMFFLFKMTVLIFLMIVTTT